MTIQTLSLSAVEHDWFATRSSEPANAPLSQHKFGYFASKSIPKGPLTQMERRWLQEVGSSTSINPYELWVAACQAQSAPVGKSISECKLNFYRKVASGTNP
jgi:hypothetical protein